MAFATVAQLVEHGTHKPGVAGSIPARGTTLFHTMQGSALDKAWREIVTASNQEQGLAAIARFNGLIDYDALFESDTRVLLEQFMTWVDRSDLGVLDETVGRSLRHARNRVFIGLARGKLT